MALFCEDSKGLGSRWLSSLWFRGLVLCLFAWLLPFLSRFVVLFLGNNAFPTGPERFAQFTA